MFDLALLDVMMPEMDGFALLPYLREQDIPVIFVSAKADVLSRVQGLRLGAEDYLVKPFDILELLVRMEKVLERSRPQAAILTHRDVVLDESSHVVIIDADIQAPTLTENPVYEVKRAIVSQEQLMRIAQCCMPGRKLFAADSSLNPLSPQPEPISTYRDVSAEFHVFSAAKPVFYRAVIGDGTRFVEGSYQTLANGQPLEVLAQLHIAHGTLAAQYVQGQYDFSDAVPEQIGSLPLQEARACALSCAQAIDKAMTLGAVQTVPLIRYMDTGSVEYRHIIAGQGVVFHFTRLVNGIPITYESAHDGRSLDSMGDDYTVPFAYEKLQMVISPEGIIGFTYQSPYEVLPNPIARVQLLPIQDIQEIITKTLPLKYAAAARSGTITLRAHRLVFGYARVLMRNDPGRYMLVPAWDLMGTWQSGDGDAFNDAHGSLLTINAADGTIIDRGFGY